MDRRIKAFLAIAETGSLTAAARALNITQPALTKTLRSLERDMGAALFDRWARGSTLTPAGNVLLEQARSMDRSWRSAAEEIRAISSGRLERLRIGAGPAYHPRIVPMLICRLAAEFPETRIEMDAGVNDSEMPRLIAGEIDLLLGAIEGEAPQDIGRHRLLDIETAVFARCDHPLATGASVSPRELAAATWLIYKKDELVQAHINAYLAAAGCGEARVGVQIGALTSGFEVVAASDYLTAAPRQLEALARQYGLARLRCADPLWRFRSGACYRKSSLAYPIVGRSIALLEEICAEEWIRDAAQD
jgi:DNA-binding transcriptional LysR family regulator